MDAVLRKAFCSIVNHPALGYLACIDPQADSGRRDSSKRESGGVPCWFLGRPRKHPCQACMCVCSLCWNISSCSCQRSSWATGAFTLQSNHVFTLPQRSELILTSHRRMGKLETALETGKICISLGLNFRSVFTVNGHNPLLESNLAVWSKSNKHVPFLCPSYPTSGTCSWLHNPQSMKKLKAKFKKC